MGRILTNCCLAVFCLSVFYTANAQQDGLAALQQIYNAYHQGKALQFTGTLRLFPKDHPGKTIDKMESRYLLRNGNYHYSLGPVEILVNDEYYISLNGEDQVMIVGRKKDLESSGQAPVLNIGRFKDLLAEKRLTATVRKQGLYQELVLSGPVALLGYTSCAIRFDPRSGYIKKVLMETDEFDDDGNKGTILEITYSAPSPLSAGKDHFSEKPFFTKKGKSIQVADRFQQFQIVNQL